MSGKKGQKRLKQLSNIREKKFIKSLVKTGEIGRSSVLAGFSDPTYGSKLIRNPRIASEIVKAMEKAGIDDPYLMTKLKEGCESVYPEKRASNGNITQKREPDYFTRSIYLDKALKIKGHYSPERHEILEKQIIINITPELVQGLLDTNAILPEEVQEIKQLEGNHGKELDSESNQE